MGYRHSQEEILETAITVALDDGMAGLTFNTVGARLGISDRTVVYYFPTKPELVAAVVAAVGGDLVGMLEQAFGSDRRTQAELIGRAWPVLTTPEADRVFALYFEIVGLASARQAPYDELAAVLVEGWAEWLTARLVGSSPQIRRRRALATLAQIDGLLLLRLIAGPAAADDAARESGVRLRR